MVTFTSHLDQVVEDPHIVLVDDDPLFAELLQRVAIKERLNLTVFTSAKEAYQTLPKMKYDVALLDYDLGRVTGVQLCNFLQSDGRAVPVMLVSNVQDIEKSEWPIAVKKAISKRAGPYTILGIARRIYRESRRKEG